MIKFIICNLNGSEILSEVNSNSKEVINICRLINSRDDASCKILAHKDLGLFAPPEYTNYFTTDYDVCLVMNSSANFFGGVENREIVETFEFLARNKKPIIYLYNDSNLPIRQLWKNIEKRTWNKWTEDDVKITAPVYIVSQFNDIERALNDNSKDVQISGISYNDFGTWLLYNYQDKFVENKGEYDLIYGGSARGGKRKAKFDNYLDASNISVACYGSMKDKDLDCQTQPEFLGRVNSNKVIETNSLGFATMIFGEKYYNNNITTIRIYESILAGCVTFIDNEFDTEHKIYNGYEFLYVNSKQELDDKVKLLKEDKEKFEEVMNVQLELLDRQSKYDCIDKLINYAKEII